jgi:hypothetical protein
MLTDEEAEAIRKKLSEGWRGPVLLRCCPECGAPRLAISLPDARATLAEIEAELDT